MLGQRFFGGRTGLLDLSGLSMEELALLDGDLLAEVLDQLMGPCGGTGARLWNNDAVQHGQ